MFTFSRSSYLFLLLQAVFSLATTPESNGPDSLSRRDQIPSSPPWILPTMLTTPPTCVTELKTCPWNGNLTTTLTESCTANQCVETFVGACMQWAEMVNLDCICPMLTATDCACATGIEDYLSLRWLNATCGILSNWTGGLAPGWASNVPIYDFIPLGNLTDGFVTEDSIYEYWLPPAYTLPRFLNNNCTVAASGRLQNSSFNATEVDEMNPNIPWSQPLSTGEADGLFLDRTSFCASSYEEIPPSCENLDRTIFLLWTENLCQNVTTKYGWPSNWEDSLILFNSSYAVPGSDPPPSCVSSQQCYSNFNSSRDPCAEATCVEGVQPDGYQPIPYLESVWTDQKYSSDPYPVEGVPHNCSSTPLAYNISCFCKGLVYGTTCNNSCQLSWERAEYLNWINSTCHFAQNWNGLPKNWTSLLQVQPNELLPWHWQMSPIKSTVSSGSNSQHCASTEAKLGAFAAVNVAMALITPILGRRDVMKKLTFGCCGHRGSKLWLLTGPLTAILHISSNFVAAIMIKNTPGYSDIDVGALILLWCTRPRLAWLVVVLLPWGAKDLIYFSVAMSTLLSEVVLQLIGSVYIGTATQYAREQKFYQLGRLTHVPHGKDALIMYAGSLLWLTVIAFAILACLMSILNVNQYVGSLVRSFRSDRRRIHNFSAHSQIEAEKRNREQSVAREFETAHSLLLNRFNIRFPADECRTLIETWKKMSRKWQEVARYVEVDLPAFQTLERDLEKKKRKHMRTRQRGQTYVNANLAADIEAATRNFEEKKARINDMPREALQDLGKSDSIFWDFSSLSRSGRIIAALAITSTAIQRGKNRVSTIDALTREDKEALVRLQRYLMELHESSAFCHRTLGSLRLVWQKQEQARQREEAERNRDPSWKLKEIAMTTVFGMFGCWIAQWVWWVGYIRLSADSYCPPKLTQIAVIWTVFSAFGAIFGASL